MELRPGYKRTEVGVIPEEWEVRPFLQIVRIANGQVDPRREPYRSMTLVAPDHIESGTGRLLDKKTAAEQRAVSGKYVFAPDDVLYSKIRPYLRKATLASFDGLCSADMYPLRPAPDISPGFVLALVLGERFSAYADSVSARSGMPKINRAELAEFVTAVPPIREQRAIATALSDVDALLAQLDRLIAKKRDIKQAAMQQLLTGKTRLPGFGGVWQVRRLGEHVTFLRNGVHSRAELTLEGSVKYLHYGDIHTSPRVRLDPSATAMPCLPEHKAATLDRLRIGDLVFADASEDMEGVGRSVEIGTIEDGSELVSGLHTIAARFDRNILVNGFKAYLQLCPAFRSQLYRLAAGTKVYSTTRNHIASIELALPSLPEQTAIATVLSDLDAELAALEVRRDKTRAIKQGMMQELLTGRTRLV